jgi:hypothetical protein
MVFLVCMVGLLLLVFGLMARELMLYRHLPEIYSLRRMTLRMSIGVMLLFSLGTILLGIRVFGLEHPYGYPSHWLAFWVCQVLLAVAICCLIIADFELPAESARERAARLRREMSVLLDGQNSEKNEHPSL